MRQNSTTCVGLVCDDSGTTVPKSCDVNWALVYDVNSAGNTEGEPLLPSRVFSDPRFENELCEFLDLGAGDLVCVPRAAEVVNSYLDEFCVRPVAHYVDLRGYGCDPNFRYAVDPPQVYELGEPSPWGIKRRDASGACVDDEWGQPDGPGQFVWEMGQHIPIEMVRARDVIEMP